MAEMVMFKYGTYQQYKDLSTKDANTLYFITDQGNARLYKGEQLLTQQWEITPGLPSINDAKPDRLYIDTNGKRISYVNAAGEWENALIAPEVEIDNKITETGEGLVSSKTVYEFVKSEIGAIIGDEESISAFVKEVTAGNGAGTLIVSHGATENTVTLKNLVHTPTWNDDERKLTLPNTTGDDLIINFGKDMVISEGSYNAETQELELTIANSNKVVKIPVASLVDTYTASDDETDAVKITVENNTIKGAILVDGASVLKIVNNKLTADLTAYIGTEAFEALKDRVKANEDDIAEIVIDINNIKTFINGTNDSSLQAKIDARIKPTSDALGTLTQTVTNMDAAHNTALENAILECKGYTDVQLLAISWKTI